MRIVLVAGYSGGGKTTAIAKLTRALVRRGKRVGTLKHIHHGGITIDSKGKDTWVQSVAGASPVVAVSPKMLVSFGRLRRKDNPVKRALSILHAEDPDYVFVEGYFRSFAGKSSLTLVCAASKREADELIRVHRRPAFICGAFAERSHSKSYAGVPLLRLRRDMQKALELIG